MGLKHIIEKMEPHNVKGETVAYIAHLKGGGFCLCGADETVLPVYLYSPHGTYDAENPEYQYFLWEISARTENLVNGLAESDPSLQPYHNALADRAVYWQKLISRQIPEREVRQEDALTVPDSMLLNLTSVWDQDIPFNDQCPAHCDVLPVALSPQYYSFAKISVCLTKQINKSNVQLF